MHPSALTGFVVIMLVFTTPTLLAQSKKDSVERKSGAKKALHQGMKLISTTPKDTVANERSTDPYVEYSGKIIRNVFIERIGFEKSLYDTTKKVEKTVTALANALHSDTREKIVRHHLFINRNEPINPGKLSDNERFLRDLDFILDSRIVLTPVEGTDSVDITVITRDVFSLGAGYGGGLPTSPKFRIFDANVSGRGQRIEYTVLFDPERSPNVGHGLYYRKSSAFGSFANVEVGYTQLNAGRSYGEEKEFAAFTRINRPLISPYSRMAGGIEVSRNWSDNVYGEPDSTFLKYNYSILDTWLGYNIGIHRAVTDRKRLFLAGRYFKGNYFDQPEQPEYEEVRRYNDLQGYLTELTFYRQDYYKTRYIYGFGRTEDVPYGISVSAAAGYFSDAGSDRPYAGIKVNYSKASKKGNFYRLILQSGGYYRNEIVEDAVIQVGAAYFTRLWNMNRYKLRNYLTATFTSIYNHSVIDLLTINSKILPGFGVDDIDANQRTAIHAETFLFTPWTVAGFRFAPFASLDVVNVNCLTCDQLDKTFLGISSGFRTRNENLIFGTMELKLTYVPSNHIGEPEFVVKFRQNLRIKNTGTFVRAPSLVLYN